MDRLEMCVHVLFGNYNIYIYIQPIIYIYIYSFSYANDSYAMNKNEGDASDTMS